ncbi:MAG: TatD family hydrolase [Oligoflexia bacterium]|nr:TatD family hydrolase [Oligoflexia bacterium]
MGIKPEDASSELREVDDVTGYWDAHCHLADERFGNDLGSVLERARALGIRRFLQGGVGPEDWDRQLRLARERPGEVLPVFGVHPWWAASHSVEELEGALGRLEGLAPAGTAIGELGLDFSRRWELTPREPQLHAFRTQLALARQLTKPLVLHVVRAHGEALKLLGEQPPEVGGLVHSFSGSPEVACQYVELGLLISVSGAVTRKGAESLRKSVVRIPPECLVIESDSPDQPPEGATTGLASGLNEPLAIFAVAKTVALLRNEAPEAVLERSAENLKRVFEHE